MWTNFLRGANINAKDVEAFAAEELNGRHIKNVTKMARLLAKESGTALQAQHIRDVLSAMKESAALL